MSHPRHVVVLGGGLAGMLAAAAVAGLAERVTVIERDTLEQGAVHRPGVPQARHVHVLWSGGARAIESLLPGTLAVLMENGARRINISEDFVCLTAHGWLPRVRGDEFAMVGTRHLLDWIVRQQATALPQVEVRDRTDAVSLTGDRARISGVQIRTADGATEDLEADLVIDATGRGSRARQWLTALGVPGAHAVRQQGVDSGLGYSTQLFEAPADTSTFPMVFVQTDIPTRGPGLSAGLLPVEGGRWLVTAGGTRGHTPPGEEAGFRDFLRATVRHPIIAELVAGLRPVSPIYTTRSTANRRIYFERLRNWPDGFVVIADGLAAFNPIYAQGMSVAAQTCVAIRSSLRARGAGTGSGHRLQRVAAGAVRGAWDMAVGVDVFYPHEGGAAPTSKDRLSLAYVNRVIRAAMERQDVAAGFYEVLTMNAPPTRLLTPRMLLAAARRRPPLPPESIAAAPLSEAERAAAGSPSTTCKLD